MKPFHLLCKKQKRKRIAQYTLNCTFLQSSELVSSSSSSESDSESLDPPLNSSDNGFYENVLDLNLPLKSNCNGNCENEIRPISPNIERPGGSGTDIVKNLSFNYPDELNSKEAKEDIRTFLGQWATENKIYQEPLRQLLHYLREHDCFRESLPKDPRTLLRTPRSNCIKSVHPGQYYHFGLVNGIKEILLKYGVENGGEIDLSIGIDGVPLTKSSAAQFWPILGRVLPFRDVFIIGLYFGYEKPSNAEEFLDDFLRETEDLCKNTFEFNNQRFVCKIKNMIFDVPAKAYILSIMHHTGFYSCPKCTIRGKWKNHRVCFPQLRTSYKNRTDGKIRNYEYKKHQTGPCCLKRIPNFDLVKNIPFDYMHLVCLGCMRKLLYLWIFGRCKHKLRKWQIQQISQQLLRLRKFIPQEFARKPRALKEIKNWKATELRMFLLYIGPVVLKGILPYNLYDNFITLHVAIRIFCGTQFLMTSGYPEYADSLLRHFVDTAALLYGVHIITHNMHGLLHLFEDVSRFGKLDNFSAFLFESFLQVLKTFVHKSEKPLQQAIRRYTENKTYSKQLKKTQESKFSFSFQHSRGPLLDNCVSPQFAVITTEEFKLDIRKISDLCCGLDSGEIILISNIAHDFNSNEPVIIGQQFQRKNDLYNTPCSSSLVDVYIVTGLSPMKAWPVKKVIKKYMIIPRKSNEFVVLALLHTQ